MNISTWSSKFKELFKSTIGLSMTRISPSTYLTLLFLLVLIYMTVIINPLFTRDFVFTYRYSRLVLGWDNGGSPTVLSSSGVADIMLDRSTLRSTDTVKLSILLGCTDGSVNGRELGCKIGFIRCTRRRLASRHR